LRGLAGRPGITEGLANPRELIEDRGGLERPVGLITLQAATCG